MSAAQTVSQGEMVLTTPGRPASRVKINLTVSRPGYCILDTLVDAFSRVSPVTVAEALTTFSRSLPRRGRDITLAELGRVLPELAIWYCEEGRPRPLTERRLPGMQLVLCLQRPPAGHNVGHCIGWIVVADSYVTRGHSPRSPDRHVPFGAPPPRMPPALRKIARTWPEFESDDDFLETYRRATSGRVIQHDTLAQWARDSDPAIAFYFKSLLPMLRAPDLPASKRSPPARAPHDAAAKGTPAGPSSPAGNNSGLSAGPTPGSWEEWDDEEVWRQALAASPSDYMVALEAAIDGPTSTRVGRLGGDPSPVITAYLGAKMAKDVDSRLITQIPGQKTMVPVPRTLTGELKDRFSFYSRAFQLPEEYSHLIPYLSVQGSFMRATRRAGGEVHNRPRVSAYPMPLASGHPLLAATRNMVQACVRRRALELGAAEHVGVYDLGGVVAKALGGEGMCFSHTCAPITPAQGDKERRATDERVANLPFTADFCRHLAEECPRLAQAIEDPLPLLMMSTDTIYYISEEWLRNIFARRSAKGWLTSLLVQFHDYSGFREGVTEHPSRYPEACVQRVGDHVRVCARGNLSIYEHRIVRVGPLHWQWRGAVYRHHVSIGSCAFIEMSGGTWGPSYGRMPLRVAPPSPTASYATALPASPAMSHFSRVTAPSSKHSGATTMVEPHAPPGGKGDPPLEGAPDYPDLLSTGLTFGSSLLLDPQELTKFWPAETMVYVGPHGLYAGARARQMAGPGSVGLEGLVATKIILSYVSNCRAGAIKGKTSNAIIESALRELKLGPIPLANRRMVAEEWASVFAVVYEDHLLRRGHDRAPALELMAIRTAEHMTPFYRPDLKVGLLWRRFKVAVAGASFKREYHTPPPLLERHCCGGQTQLIPANVARASSMGEARTLAYLNSSATFHAVPFAAIVEMPDMSHECLNKGYVTQIGPTFDTRPGAAVGCIHNKVKGSLERQCGNKGGDSSGVDPGLPALVAQQLHEFLTTGPTAGEYFAACGQNMQTWDEWAARYQGNVIAALEAANERLMADPIDHTTKVEVFVKNEFHDSYRHGSRIKETAPRVISDRNKYDKVSMLGTIPLVTSVLKASVPAYCSSKSPIQVDERITAALRRFGTDAVAVTTDFSRMDGNTSISVKNAAASFYLMVLQNCIELGTDAGLHMMIPTLRAVLEARAVSSCTASDIRIPSLRGMFEKFTFAIAGTVASGDLDTTLGNNVTNLMVLYHALLACGLIMDDDVVSCVSGDDGIHVCRPDVAARLAAQLPRSATLFGMTLKTAISSFRGPGERPGFCSRVFLLHYDQAEGWQARGIRLLTRAMIRFGHTVRADVGSGLGLLKAKALSEMCWAEGIPVVQALFTGTLARRDVDQADISLDQDTISKLLAYADPGQWRDGHTNPRSHKREIARRFARTCPRAFKEPTPSMRMAFAEYTGISPEDQVELERFITAAVQQDRAYIPDDLMCGLIRDEWL